MIWNDEFETMPREALEALQLKRLRAVVERVYATVPFYRRRLDEAGVTPDSIKSLEDLQRIPFTTKDDLRENYPYGLFAVPLKQVVRIHASSGTTGKPQWWVTPGGTWRRGQNSWPALWPVLEPLRTMWSTTPMVTVSSLGGWVPTMERRGSGLQ